MVHAGRGVRVPRPTSPRRLAISKRSAAFVKVRPKGNGFEARPSINGRQISVYRRTEKEVLDELARLRLGQNPKDVSRFTVEKWLMEWLGREKARVETGRRALNTYVTRKAALDAHVIPHLGHITLAALERSTVKQHFERLEQIAASKGLSRHSGQKGTRVLQIAFETARTAFNEAIEDGLLEGPNPFAAPPGSRRSIKPHHEQAARDFLTWDQAITLLGELQAGDYPAHAYPLILTALTTGMRQGELLGLRKDRVDLGVGVVHVDAQASATTSAGLQLKRPKMSKARTKSRDITLPVETVTVLGAWLDRVAGELVFPNSAGGFIGRGNFMARVFRPALDAAGLPSVDFHSLRHTHASVLLSRGVNIKTLSQRLGHESVRLTLDTYGHLMPDDDAKAAQVFDGILSKQRRLRAITSVG